MKRLTIVLLVVVAGLLLASCATGPAFVEQAIPDGQAIVYFYRPYRFFSSSLPISMMTKDGHAGTSMIAGEYCFYLTKPSSLKFWGEAGVPITPFTLDAAKGQSYFVKINIPDSFKLTLVPPETAQTEIAKCKLASQH